jgi:ATP-dependent Clp protease ATP-binding subunit ClpB
MSSILRPNLGFAASEMERKCSEGLVDGSLTDKISRAGVEAARRKFTPEFMNRIDKVIVFRPLGEPELRKILGLELSILQHRIFNSANGAPFLFSLTDPAKDFLLREGTDMKYGARHLKRAIDRSLVHPLSNLIATEQVRGGDLLKVDYDTELERMTFFKEAEDMPAYTMMQMMEAPVTNPVGTFTTGAGAEVPRSTIARSTRR